MPDGRKIPLKDNRKVSGATGLPIQTPRTGEYDYEVLSNIVKAAKDEGVDPYTALAVGLQESGLGTKHPNLGQVEYSKVSTNKKRLEELQARTKDGPDEVYKSARSLAYMLKASAEDADGAGYFKADEAQRLQAYNGYGKIGANNDIGAKQLYGIDLTKNTIDMAKTPLYGKTVVDIRDNIIKQSPEIKELIQAYDLDENELNGLTVSHANNKYTFKKDGKVVGEADGEKSELKTAAAKNAYLRSLYLKAKQAKADQSLASINKTLTR